MSFIQKVKIKMEELTPEIIFKNIITSIMDKGKIVCKNEEELNQAYKEFKKQSDYVNKHGGVWNPCKIWGAGTVEALWKLYFKDKDKYKPLEKNNE